MRLIDADKMLAELEEGYDDCDIEEMLEFVGISNCIKRQPTAYDVNKVIEEIWDCEHITISSSNSIEPKLGIDLEEVLDIVERGGIDDISISNKV